MNHEKATQYTQKIGSALTEILNPDSENFIGEEVTENPDDFTLFLHCLCNIAPQMIVSKLQNEVEFDSFLDFNHFANKLCFQFMKKSEE